MNKIFYWSPFISKVATVKSVINSIISINNFNNEKNFELSIINAVNEWGEYKDLLKEKKIGLINLVYSDFFINFKKEGFLRSRYIYWYIFIKCFFPLKKLLINEKPKFLIVHLITSLPLILFCFTKFDTKLILRISGLPKMNFIRKTLWRFASKNIYKITCPTEATLKNLSKYEFLKDKLEILYDPILNLKDIQKTKMINTPIKKTLQNIIDSKKFILSIGRLTKQKNFIFFLKCIPEILRIDKDLFFLFIGKGEDEKKIKKISKELNISHKIFILNQTDNVHYFMNKAKAFVLTSLWEDPGFVLVEAGYNNCIVISSDCPNGPLEIIGHDGGYLFTSNSKTSFIKVFKNFLETSEEQNKLKKIILKKKIKKFTLFNHKQIMLSKILI